MESIAGLPFDSLITHHHALLHCGAGGAVLLRGRLAGGRRHALRPLGPGTCWGRSPSLVSPFIASIFSLSLLQTQSGIQLIKINPTTGKVAPDSVPLPFELEAQVTVE